METEITLLGVSGLTLVVSKVKTKEYQFAFAARVGMSAMLLLTGIAHFAFAKGMSMMLPDFIPGRYFLIYATGIAELSAAVGLHFQRWRKITAKCLILFFILLTPANIYAAFIHLNLQNGTLTGPGPEYLWYRIPLQIFFIAWVYLSSIGSQKSKFKNQKPKITSTINQRSEIKKSDINLNI